MAQRSPQALRILVEDEHFVGLVKPAGLPTANAARGEPSVFTILKQQLGPGAFLGIVSRLDAPVSGVVVVARTPRAAAALAEQFRERTVRKHYLAVVTGRFPAPTAAWVDWHDTISRREGQRKSTLHRAAAGGNPPPAHDDAMEDAVEDSAGAEGLRPAHVRCRVMQRAGEVSLVELEPSTGRRHQLRLQLASRGCPIVGDRLYGSRLPFPDGGIALHAARLEFEHPATGRLVVLESDRPESWGRLFPSLGKKPRNA